MTPVPTLRRAARCESRRRSPTTRYCEACGAPTDAAHAGPRRGRPVPASRRVSRTAASSTTATRTRSRCATTTAPGVVVCDGVSNSAAAARRRIRRRWRTTAVARSAPSVPVRRIDAGRRTRSARSRGARPGNDAAGVHGRRRDVGRRACTSAWAGDSRAYWVDVRGAITVLTTDHSLAVSDGRRLAGPARPHDHPLARRRARPTSRRRPVLRPAGAGPCRGVHRRAVEPRRRRRDRRSIVAGCTACRPVEVARRLVAAAVAAAATTTSPSPSSTSTSMSEETDGEVRRRRPTRTSTCRPAPRVDAIVTVTASSDGDGRRRRARPPTAVVLVLDMSGSMRPMRKIARR